LFWCYIFGVFRQWLFSAAFFPKFNRLVAK